MTFTDEQSFRLHVENEPFARVYFIYGTENYLKKNYINKLIKRAVPNASASFNYMELDGKTQSVDTIADAVMAVPLFGLQKFVFVSDFNAEQLTENDFLKLKELLDDLPDSSVLLFATLTQDIGAKKNIPAKWSRFIKLVDKAGMVMELKARSESDLVGYARAYAKKQGCDLEVAAARELCERCLYKLDYLKNELDKLCTYKQKGEITATDIDLLCEKQLEALVYDLSKAIAEKDYTKALGLIDIYRYKREEPVAVLAALTSSYNDFYRIKTGMLAGKQSKEIFKDFGYKGNPNRFYYVEKDAQRLPLKYITAALDILLQCDYDMKSSRVDSYTLLEETVTKLLILHANEGKG